MEDYKEKYEQALDYMRTVYPTLNGATKEDVEHYFSELKESEDERIRKWLIGVIKSNEYGNISNVGEMPCPKSNVIAWLEKQGEKIDIANKEYWRGYREGKQEIIDKYSELEKQGKQSPIDKVEPKFKVGDIIINEYGFIMQIDRIDGNMYVYHVLNSERLLKHDITKTDESCHLWTIKDAKDGEVLATKNCNPFIYDKNRYNNGLAYYYAGLDVNKELTLKSPHHMLAHFGELCSVSPATKEQRDLLFQKMKEAGYEWDDEKKELKKIEQKPTEWSDRDWYFYSKLESFLEVKDHYSPTESSSGYQKDVHETLIWLKSLRPNKYVTWSEEDENLYTRCMSAIQTRFNDGLFTTNEYRQTSLWLKSLKERMKGE